jgi:cobalt/nickel transport system permease protein
VSAGHTHGLYRPGDTVVHRLPAHCKLVAVIVFVLLVVATPRTAFWAFAAYALLLAGVSALAQVPPATLLRRMTVEVPFVLFALLLPFVAEGPRVDVLGVAVSESGLLAAWNILAKGTLGVLAAVLLAATTPARQLLLGLERLHMPALMVQIMSFMFRYANVVGAEMARMKVARESRGFQGRDLRHARVVAQSAGALFIRSYERGERVHLAMLSRGYTGRMPTVVELRADRRQWAVSAALPTAALAILGTAWLARL